MLHAKNIKWNSQRDNKRVGTISPGSQCGYTSVAMALSLFHPQAESDAFIANMVDDIEPLVGTPGWGESFFQRAGWKGGWIYSQVFGGKARAGAYFSVYNAWTVDFVRDNRLECTVEFKENDGDWNRVKAILKEGNPVVIGTRILPSGHYITLVSYDEATDTFTAKDPWGDPISGYKSQNGDNVKIKGSWLVSRAPDARGKVGACRYLALIKK